MPQNQLTRKSNKTGEVKMEEVKGNKALQIK